jgi:hypothetical protein
MRLRAELTEFSSHPETFRPTPSALRLLEAEHAKAIEEIKLRISQEDQWFHNKFYLVGGLLGALLFYLSSSRKEEERNLSQLRGFFESPTSCTVLALACVVAVAIDIHQRNNIVVVQQLGLWISNYVEPALLQERAPQEVGSFLPWEEFLRVETPGAAMHRDDLYGLAFYPHLHFLTWALYMLYLVTLQKAALARPHPQEARMVLGGLGLVQLSFAGLTWLGHAAPAAFEFKVIPYVNWWASGWLATSVYGLPYLLLVLAVLPYAYNLWGRGLIRDTDDG